MGRLLTACPRPRSERLSSEPSTVLYSVPWRDPASRGPVGVRYGPRRTPGPRAALPSILPFRHLLVDDGEIAIARRDHGQSLGQCGTREVLGGAGRERGRPRGFRSEGPCSGRWKSCSHGRGRRTTCGSLSPRRIGQLKARFPRTGPGACPPLHSLDSCNMLKTGWLWR